MLQIAPIASASPDGILFSGPKLSKRTVRRINRTEREAFDILVQRVSEQGIYRGEFDARSTSQTIGSRKDATLHHKTKSVRRERSPGFRRRIRQEKRFALLNKLDNMSNAQFREWYDLFKLLS